MKTRTLVQGSERRENGKLYPMNLVLEGHLPPRLAYADAVRQGMSGHHYMVVIHEIFDLPRWHKEEDESDFIEKEYP